jgi:hypothetical protein
MPNTKEMETLARGLARMTGSLTAPPPDELPSEEWWQSVLADPRAAGKPSGDIFPNRVRASFSSDAPHETSLPLTPWFSQQSC